MRLERLKRFVGIKKWISVLQAHHQADRDALILHPVDPAAAIDFSRHRPAQRVGDKSRLDASVWNFPKLLHADSISLRVQVVQLVAADELLGQRAARTFSQDG